MEFQSTRDLSFLRTVELKIRSTLSAGQLIQSARHIQKTLNGNKYQHIHIVGSIDVEALKADPIVEPARYAEFFRRANLLAEMVTVVEDVLSVNQNASKDVVFFDGASSELMAGVGNYFSELGRGKVPQIQDRYKMAFVGFRGLDTYDQPGLMGLEYRSINSVSNIDQMATVMNRLQQMLWTGDFGISRETIAKWIQSMPNPENLGGALMGIWYQQPFASLFANAHPEVKSVIIENRWKAEEFEQHFSKEQKDVRMLFYNWGFDPLLSGQPELLNRVLAEQVSLLKRWKGVPIQAIGSTDVIELLDRSGLYQRVLDSFQIPYGPSP